MSARTIVPSADTVIKNLPDGDSPMDVINAIVNRGTPDAESKMRSEFVAQANEEAKKAVIPDPIKDEESKTAALEKVIEPVKVEEPAKIETAAELPLEEDEIDEPGTQNPVKDKYKNLKKTYFETKQQIKEKDAKLQALEQEVEEIKQGRVIPDSYKEILARNQELERYERLHALKTSKHYHENFVKPIEEVKSKISEIAAEYNVPEYVIDDMLNTESRRELSQMLSENFEQLDAIEVKTLIDKAKALTKSAREAELEPAKVLREMEESNKVMQQQEELRRKQGIISKASSAWQKSLTDIRKEGLLLELIPNPNDSEFNKNYVEPITNAAAQEFNKAVNMLADAGLKELPDELAYYLSKLTATAHASAVAAETRNKAVTDVNKLLETTKRKNAYYRPPVGTSAAPSVPARPQRETTADRADALIQAGLKYANNVR